MTGRVVVCDAYPASLGGAHRVAEMFARELPAHGWSVRVVFPAPGEAPRMLRDRGLDVTVLDAPTSLRTYGAELHGRARLLAALSLPVYWRRVARWLRDNADVVWVNDLRGWLLFGPPARLARRKLVWHVHAPGAPQSWPKLALPLLRLVDHVAAAMSHRVVVPSARALSRRQGRTRVLANAVDVPHWQWSDPGGKPPVVLTVGRLYPVKGMDVLLEASALLAQRGVDHRLQVVGAQQPGRRDYAEELQRLCAARGLADVVEFVGHVDDPAPLLQGATVYVQPSRAEGFGLAVLEAMAAGVPVVATAVGGLLDLVEDGVTGIQVAPGDPAALADALEQVLGDSGLRTRLGKAARELAMADYAADHFGRSAAEICTEICTGTCGEDSRGGGRSR